MTALELEAVSLRKVHLRIQRQLANLEAEEKLLVQVRGASCDATGVRRCRGATSCQQRGQGGSTSWKTLKPRRSCWFRWVQARGAKAAVLKRGLRSVQQPGWAAMTAALRGAAAGVTPSFATALSDCLQFHN